MNPYWLATFSLALALTNPPITALTHNHPKASLTPCRGFLFVQKHRTEILLAASRYEIPPVAVAGVIAAEFTLNRDLVDTMQDEWLTAQLAWHDEVWWTRWAQTRAQEAERDAAARLLGNKWSVSIIASGYVMSFGPAQIQPKTAVRACSSSEAKEPICSSSIKALMTALLDDAMSIGLVALIQRYEADLWASERKTDVRQNVAFLATLYSSGAEYRNATFSVRGHTPNRMGRWIEARTEVLSDLLDGRQLDGDTSAAKMLCHTDK
nr:hypothetical protein [Nitrosomonas nitrosa]